MFVNKDQFTETFKTRLESYYGIPFEDSTLHQKYVVLADMVREYATDKWRLTREKIREQKLKQVYYFSMEYLMGRLLTNNLQNLGIYETVKAGLEDLGLDINQIEEEESDLGLGNGGLGRLAACFLDSIASLNYPGHGHCIRYRRGFFEQKFVDGKQVELPEQWLEKDFVWEVKREDEAVIVPFYGEVRFEEVKGKLQVRYENPWLVRAVPYDVPVIGYKGKTVNTLTLWSAEVGEFPKGVDPYQYQKDIEEISSSLYPDDSTEEGKYLRLKQQYFFVSAGVQRILKEHRAVHGTLRNLPEYVVIQINDTHPTLVIPELMRILIDEEGLSWEEAWEMTTKMCAYTNHTIMAEALEKWPLQMIQTLLPRIYLIIEEIDRRFKLELVERYGEKDERVKTMAIIQGDLIHMAHLCIVGSFSVNGVAELHTNILKEVEMKDFHLHFPGKFNNKTNGITHRRWAYQINPELTAFLNKYVGSDWVENIEKLSVLNQYVKDPQVKQEFRQVKQRRKAILAEYIERKEGITIDVDSIFDIQIKRLHEYKRQLMNGLHILYLYNRLKEDQAFYDNFYPQTFIFGAKAAGSYRMAKNIIYFINKLSEVVNNDSVVSKKIKVIFVENYNVSYAEKLIPAANLSEQISTASKEASGTGNMKFMMNGAVTIGTMDGANVEIVGLVGKENAFIFGISADEANDYYRKKNYRSRDIYESDPDVRRVVDQLVNGFFKDADPIPLKEIYDDLLNRDYFFVLKDFSCYKEAQRLANETYKDQDRFLEMALINVANSSFFSSDRTIEQYVQDIWKLKKINW